MAGKPGMRATTFKVPPDLLRKINVLASVKGGTNSDLVVEAVQEFIAKPENQEAIRNELMTLTTAK